MDRDPDLERHLVTIAARAAGHGSDGGLLAYAASRALPEPIHLPREWDREIGEEIADGANYCTWSIQEIWPLVVSGDPDVMDRYERHMRTLTFLVGAWHALHTSGV